jgi:hypothetical protein
MSFKFTTQITTGANAPEDAPSQELGAKAFTTDGQLAIYIKANAAIAAKTACVILADGTASLTGTGIKAISDYAIEAGKYGYVSYVFPTATLS